MHVTLIGTGLMGEPMGERLLDQGFQLTVHNRTPEKTAALTARGAKRADTVAHAVAASPCSLLMLRDGAAVRSVLAEVGPEIAGRTILQMSTIGSQESVEIGKEVAAHGGEYVEAPVLGSVGHARDGKLQVMVGGTAAQFQRWHHVFAALGRPLHAGWVGQASALKLALNQLIACQAAGFSLSLGMVRRRQVDVDLFMDVVRASPIYSASFDTRLKRYLERDYDNPTFPTELLLKDVELAREEAALLGLATVTIDGVREVVARAVAAGHGRDDYGALYEAIDPAGPAQD